MPRHLVLIHLEDIFSTELRVPLCNNRHMCWEPTSSLYIFEEILLLTVAVRRPDPELEQSCYNRD